MRVGDLYELLKELEQAEKAVAIIEERLLRNEDEKFIQQNQSALEDAKHLVFNLREVEIRL